MLSAMFVTAAKQLVLLDGYSVARDYYTRRFILTVLVGIRNTGCPQKVSHYQMIKNRIEAL